MARHPTISQHLAQWTAALSLDHVPDDVVHAAKRCIVDTVGVSIAGSATPVSRSVRQNAKQTYSTGQCSLFGDADYLSPAGAALVNGVAAHALDFDDTSYAGIIHGSAVTFPAVLAAVASKNGNGQTLLEAFIAGVETVYAMGLTVTDSHYLKGWWATASCGIVGAAAGASKALALDGEQTTNAIGLAAVQAFGAMAILGTDAKPFLAGHAAMSGLVSAQMARDGMTAPDEAFEDKRGFFQLMNDGNSDADGLAQLGRIWRLKEPGIFIKTYPVCSAAHAATQLTERLLREHDLGSDEIEYIQCDVPRLVAISLVHESPTTPAEAQFSLQFAVGSILAFGELGPGQLTANHLSNRRLREAMGKVRMSEADDLNAAEIKNRHPECARISIKTMEDRTVSGFLGAPRGMPENPFSDDDVADKFRRCCSFAGWPKSRSEPLLDNLWMLETLPSMSKALEGNVQ